MDLDLISFETLIATRDSADWVMWGAIATGLAAASSLLTLYFARAALNTWKMQEQTKIKSEFKRSLLALDYAIHMMPDEWNMSTAMMVQVRSKSFIISEGDDAVMAGLSELKKCWHNAISAWVMCEGLLKETSLTKSWKELSDVYSQYIQGRANKISILTKLAEMHSVEFIFD
ncbi:hypothetical protein [Pantoea agglomerans]|uniref:hypothetical protein n=1 Tax=Enterobacter agglomerans TaxID=549 RepID=UPI000A503908|nr:hypothetical protein [Pantoea agglomerans]